MLITRCPDCRTSFRITVDMLHKADGKVRCGRCESVFSAFNSLADTRTDLRALGGAEVARASVRPARDDDIATTSEIFDALADLDTDDPARADSVVDTELISEHEVDHVLEVSDAEPTPPWTLQQSHAEARPFWTIAAIVAAGVLLAQIAHHVRSEIVTLPLVGSPVAAFYARLGIPAHAIADPTDYEIVDWTATAQTDRAELDTLRISAGIHNRSDEARPLPLLFLRLTDRFDNAIGSRYFEPAEYLGSSGATTMLPPGTTASAHFELVDPGPQAYGFEVDICVRLSAAALRCKADLVFE